MRWQNLMKILVGGACAATSFLVISVGLSFLLPADPASDDLSYQIQLLIVTGDRFYFILAGLFIFMVAWSFLYFLVRHSLPGPTWAKGLLFGLLVVFAGFWLQHRFYLSLLYRDWPAGLLGWGLFNLLIASLTAGIILALVQEKA